MTEAHALLLLHLLPGIGYTTKVALYRLAGSARRVLSGAFDEEVSSAVLQRLHKALTALPRTEQHVAEVEAFNTKYHIRTLTLADTDYPERLRHTHEPPFVLFVRGEGYDLNARHIVAVVGTRQISPYGQDLCRHTMQALSALPDTLIVSGLAYGIDICAHREAIKAGLPNVAVLAHGLDRIYPALHTDTAKQLIHHGALLTEYPPQTHPDKGNFVRRNRIVAGLCDACLVVESAEKGGALITAQLAFDYNREVLAYPGRTTDASSQGCNALIAQNKAKLLLSSEQILHTMGWEIALKPPPEAVQTTLFDENLSPAEQAILMALANTDGKSLNELVVATGYNIAEITAAAITLEMMGRVAGMAGSTYRILN